jgi:hypothetical protein
MNGPALAALRGLAIAVPLGCAVLGLVATDSVLVGGAAWSIALVACLAGWGHLVRRWLGADADLGLVLAWGAGAAMTVAGVLLAAGVLSRPALLALIAVGLAAFAWQQATAAPPAVPAWLAAARAHPSRTAFWLLIAVIAGVNALCALAAVDGNVYDDDIIYTPMVRRLLEIGDLDEPFSFRRLSAYGGQTVLQGLAAARGTLANLYLADGVVFQLIALLLVTGMAYPPKSSGSRTRIDEVLVGLGVLVLVLLPSTAVNTASYWTGVVFFVATYRTVVAAGADGALTARGFAVAGTLAACAGTLRQSYLPVAILFLLAVLVARRPRWRDGGERRLWLATALGGAIALVPYALAALRSNHTFLYPFWAGTANPHIHTRPALASAWHELQFFVEVTLEPDPIRVALPLLPVLLLARDRRPGRPLLALALASGAGYLLLVHSFLLSVPQNLWRYAFGYTTALVLVLIVEVARSADTDGDAPVQVSTLGRLILAGALLVQLAVSGRGLAREYRDAAGDLQAAVATGGVPIGEAAVARAYRELQAAVPAGVTLAVLLDQPFHLDHARNHVINLDTPGYASFRPGLPFFQGPAPVIDYFLRHGIRYLAFVRADRSRYMYRRDFWLQRMLFDTELWRVQGAYMVDFLDTTAAIAAQRRILLERDGMVVVDLAEAP